MQRHEERNTRSWCVREICRFFCLLFECWARFEEEKRCCANDGQSFTQRNSLYRMQIGGQLKMRNDEIDVRDETVRRVCIDTSCTMNWKWHVYTYIYFFMTIERNHHKAVITIKQAKKHMHTNCYPYAVACRTHRVGREKYAFVSRSINANVKIIQIDGTRYSSVVCSYCQNVLCAFDGERGNLLLLLLLLLGKCKNIRCGDGNGTAISIAINKWIEVSYVFTWSIVMRIRHPTDSIPNWLCNVVAAEANEKKIRT